MVSGPRQTWAYILVLPCYRFPGSFLYKMEIILVLRKVVKDSVRSSCKVRSTVLGTEHIRVQKMIAIIAVEPLSAQAPSVPTDLGILVRMLGTLFSPWSQERLKLGNKKVNAFV